MDKKEKEYLRINSKLKYLIFLIIYFFLYPIAKIIFGRKKKWLICERGIDAQDNGFAFYKYLLNEHKEIIPIYLIKRNSADYEKVRICGGKIVEFGSFKHFIMAIGCHIKISSHLYGYAPWIQMALYFRRNKTIDKHVFLQHGITKNDQPGFYKENNKSLSLFVCGAKPEYDYIFNYFGYRNSVPQYTGFPRYDSLNNTVEKNQLLFMPTWRRHLKNLSLNEFEKTNFYISWMQLLDNKNLLSFCRSNKLLIKFYLHNSFQNYNSLFEGNDVVSIVEFKDEDVQSLLKESKLLVTDFSSVYFDFAYMKKPVVYYQFDEEEYYKNHYLKGYFDYRNDGFGCVCVDEVSVVNEIINSIKTNFIVNEKYLKRIKKNFTFCDDNNCKRVFESIENLLK